MNGLAPIIEGFSGKREFLLSSQNPYRAPYVASRTQPFPDAASIELVLKGKRSDNRWTEQYGVGRAANNLGAVHMCNNHLQAALEAIQESELKFVEMINEGCPYPEQLTYSGLAMVRYNAALLFLLAGDVMNNYANAETNRVMATEALDEADELDRELDMTGDDDREFVRSALAALPVLTKE